MVLVTKNLVTGTEQVSKDWSSELQTMYGMLTINLKRDRTIITIKLGNEIETGPVYGGNQRNQGYHRQGRDRRENNYSGYLCSSHFRFRKNATRCDDKEACRMAHLVSEQSKNDLRLPRYKRV